MSRRTALSVPLLLAFPPSSGDSCIVPWYDHDPCDRCISCSYLIFLRSVLIGSGHLKLDRSLIMERSLSYEMLRWVRPTKLGCCYPSRSLPVCLNWFEGLELPIESFLAGWLVTKTCCVATRMSSSSVEYLFTRLNKSSIVVGGFLVRDSKKGVLGHILL